MENRPPPAALANAPTAHGLRGDYSAMRADWTIAQPVGSYTSADHALWRTLYERQTKLVRDYAAPVFVKSLRDMECADAIPDMERLSTRLRKATGWEVVAVPGLLPNEVFFDHLANRRFPSSWWIRKPEELDYLVEPDVFHDLFGHVPLLFDPVFADYMQQYGLGGPKAIEHDAVDILARLYWYMVEFGLIMTDDGVKAYGAGMLSSFGETQFSVDDPAPNRIGFDLERVMRTRYWIDRYQSTYFVLPDFERLFRDSIDTDFGPLYERIKGHEPYAPDAVVDGDRVIHRGAAA
ncbi:MAG: phenylalanine-4-hydroxylase [Alphaproteobacteria bacterium]|nr:MAG: phenylalanine-4-hydroxylase [Caulobacteraceae bacterium]TPW06975.1 MAG: phenylalanine-4-hydroxylase [Alphaproteobacteria bacterium]